MNEENKSIVNPFGSIENDDICVAVSCYTDRIINIFLEKYEGVKIGKVSKTDIYKIRYNNTNIIIYKSPLGASWAGLVLEDLIYCGIKTFIYFGSCGSIGDDKEYDILLPVKALREEGTSYHYKKYGKIIKTNKKMIDKFENFLKKNKISYKEGFVWTTDSPYRETNIKVDKYKKMGVNCVDMETSALQVISNYRNVDILNYFYTADSLNNGKWNKRCLGQKNEIVNEFFELALKFVSEGELYG